MAKRKKSKAPANRKSNAPKPVQESAPSTGVVEKSAVTGVKSAPPQAPKPTERAEPKTRFLETPTGSFFHRLFKIASSLQLAITLLSLFTISLIAATQLESRHNMDIAHELVYNAWWFILLLALLGTNIICAALKKADPQKFFSDSLFLSAGSLILIVGSCLGVGIGLFYLHTKVAGATPNALASLFPLVGVSAFLLAAAMKTGDPRTAFSARSPLLSIVMGAGVGLAAFLFLDEVGVLSTTYTMLKRDVLFRWGCMVMMAVGTYVAIAATGLLDGLHQAIRVHWPWRRYQTGFLVTHLGLITLVMGGFIQILSGIEGVVALVDTPNREYWSGQYGKGTDRNFHISGESYIDVFELKDTEDQASLSRAKTRIENGGMSFPPEEKKVVKARYSYVFNHGSLPWHDDEEFDNRMPWHLKLLQVTSDPVRSFQRKVTEGVSFKVTNYWPHTALWPYHHASSEEQKKKSPFPAVHFKLRSRLFEGIPRVWVSGLPSDLSRGSVGDFILDHQARETRAQRYLLPNQKTISLEVLSIQSRTLLKEFLNPPDWNKSSEVGEKGQLVIFVKKGNSSEPVRIAVEEKSLNKEIPLKGIPGVKVKITNIGNYTDHIDLKRTVFDRFNTFETLTQLFPFRTLFTENEVKKFREEVEQAQGAEKNQKLQEFTRELQKRQEARLKEYVERLSKTFEYPMVQFELIKGETKSKHLACARIPDLPNHEDAGAPVTAIEAMYHYPDAFWGRKQYKAGAQFVRENNRLHYRAVDPCGYPIGPGRENIKVGIHPETRYELPLRSSMSTSFAALEWIQEAVERKDKRIQPRTPARFGAKSPTVERYDSDTGDSYTAPLWFSAFRGVMKVGTKEYPLDVRLVGSTPEIVHEDGSGTKRIFMVRLRQAQKALPFEIELRRVHSEKDPGSTRNATYRSEITVYDLDKQGKRLKVGGSEKKKDYSLYMNHTVDKAGYRLFQANFQQTNRFDRELGRFVNHSGIQVAKDPGLETKYAGTLIVVLGIFMMFYMKAYFFTATGKKKPPTVSTVQGGGNHSEHVSSERKPESPSEEPDA